MRTGAELVAAERQRQITAEGFTAEHDAKHGPREFLDAGRAYRYASRNHWPWGDGFKPKPGRLRNLVRAGALYQAGIDFVTDAPESLKPWAHGWSQVLVQGLTGVVSEIDDLLAEMTEHFEREGRHE